MGDAHRVEANGYRSSPASLLDATSLKRHLANGESQQDSHSASQTSSPLPSNGSVRSNVTSPLTSPPKSPSPSIHTDSNEEGRAKPAALQPSPAIKTLPRYNPSQLLNPKSLTKKSAPDEMDDLPLETPATKPASGISTLPQFVFDSLIPDRGEQMIIEDQDSGLGGLIERVHNVSKREERPMKRQKIKHEDEVEADNASKSTFTGGGKDSEIAEYLREKRKEGLEESGPTSAVVDLTAGTYCFSNLFATLLIYKKMTTIMKTRKSATAGLKVQRCRPMLCHIRTPRHRT